ncbi:MAG: bifunctional demethylmenaquinone methyltransferase/2-methoxy-6-polyprenyl-1,4-benzoquinol methylase UbiE [Phycisphaerales bacterium]
MPQTPVWTDETLAGDPHADAEKARKVQAMFAAIARRYDLNNRVHSLWQDQRWRRAAVRAANVAPTTRVLDVACGTGDLTLAFAAAGAGTVTGVDFTPQMLDIARHKAGAPTQRISFEEGDAMRLRFADRSMDVVSIAFGIRNVTEPQQALREFARVLAPGGRLVILEFAEPANALLRAASNLYTRQIMPWTATLLAWDRSGAYRYLPRSVSTFMDPAALRQAMQRAGFQQISDTSLSGGICRLYRGVRP